MTFDECDQCFQAYPTGSAHECPLPEEVSEYDGAGEEVDRAIDAWKEERFND